MYEEENDRHQVLETKTCSECGESFDITQGDHDFYQKNNYELPKRCKQCRYNNRIKRSQER